MTHQGHGFSLLLEGGEQGNGIGVLHQIPQRAVSARIKNRVIIGSLDFTQFQSMRELLFERFVLVKPVSKFGLRRSLLAFGIDRRQPAFGGRQGDFRAGIHQFIIRGRELFHPETGFLAGVTQLAMRG